MTALYMPSSTAWGPPQHLQHRSTPDVIFPVAYSVAEAALKSGPNSPSFGQSMNCLMDAAALDSHWGGNANVASWPKVKTRRVASFAGRGRPLWEVVEHAKERREKKTPTFPASPEFESYTHDYSHSVSPIGLGLAAAIDDSTPTYKDVTILTTRSADPSPVDTIDATFAQMAGLGHGRSPRMSARDFASRSTSSSPRTPSHSRTMSDRSPSQVLRSQATPTSRRAIARMPSLAQIQAKMNRSPDVTAVRGNSRSDSMDSQDSEGPRTPTDELSSFEFAMHAHRPATPDSPAKESRLAPFLRERTNGRLNLARPKSMPPLAGDVLLDFYPTPLPVDKRHSTFPLDRPPRSAPLRQGSLPSTPQSKRYSPIRTWNSEEVTLVVTPPKAAQYEQPPTSPTESVLSTVSSVPSLPIITCTPAVEADSDEESEGDVIVFSGELEEEHDSDDDNDDIERFKIGREMLSRLSRRASDGGR